MSLIDWSTAPRSTSKGVSKVAIYWSTIRARSWTGVVSIEELEEEAGSTTYYQEGRRFMSERPAGTFGARIKCLTYPAILDDMYTRDFSRQFDMTYETTRIEDGVEVRQVHFVYNALITPIDLDFETIADDPELTLIGFEISCVPEEVPGYRPTAHIIIEVPSTNPYLWEIVQDRIFGTNTTSNAALIRPDELLPLFADWITLKVTDLGNGLADIEWMGRLPDRAISSVNWVSTFPEPDPDPTNTDDYFIDWPSATIIDAETYEIESL